MMLANSNYKETTLAFPFKISSKGTVSIINDQEAIWSNKVKSVIGTLVKERVMLPSFGSRLGEVLWNTEGFAKQNVSSFIEQAFVTWLPNLGLTEVVVSDIDADGQLNIYVSYTLPNNKNSMTTIGVVGISGNLQPTQEIR
jgi:phage baseplate assembly protein W